MIEFSPMSALISTIFTLENYIRHYELIAIKSCRGFKQIYCQYRFLFFSLFLTLVLYVLMEFVLPPLDQYANKIKAAAISKNENLMIGEQGFGAKENNTFINIKKIRPGRILEDIYFYETEGPGQIKKIIYAKNANIIDHHNLDLFNVTEKKFAKDSIESTHFDKLTMHITADFLKGKIIYVPIEAASLSELLNQIKGLNERGENADYVTSIFWQKVATPLSVLSMILLCLPLLINRIPARKELSFEISFAIIGGGALYLFRYILGYIVLIYNFDPFALIVGPILAILGIDCVFND